MQSPGKSQRKSTRAATALAVLLVLAGTASLYWRSRGGQPAAGPAANAEGPVYSIVLPHAEPIPPRGPNRADFEAFCLKCHSPRLVVNQPRLPEKKWSDVVHKMVVAYGAPLSPEKEQDVVVYLNSIRGLQGESAGH